MNDACNQMNIRKWIFSSNRLLVLSLKKSNDFNEKSYGLTLSLFYKDKFSNNLRTPYNDRIINIYKVILGLSIMTLASDYYIANTYFGKINGFDEEKKNILKSLMEDITNMDFDNMVLNTNTIINVVNNTCRIIDLSALDKILMFKSLEIKDIKILSEFNPLFMDEYNYYNITITKEFVLKHLDIWIKRTSLEEGIIKLTEFIINLWFVNYDSRNDILSLLDVYSDINAFRETIEAKDKDKISSYIRNLYEEDLKLKLV